MDSEIVLNALLGKSRTGRPTLVQLGIQALAVVKRNWEDNGPENGKPEDTLTNIELGNNSLPQL